MSKVKTKKVAGKRFKITKTGKVMHRTQGRRHVRQNKSAAHKRRQDSSKTLDNKAYIVTIKRFIQS